MMSLDELREIVAEHDAIPKDDRVFHDPPKIEIAQHCIECGQDIEPVVFGWDLLREAAKGDDGLPVRIGTICERCQRKEGQSMSRIIVHSIDDMPGEARDGLPLGCVIDKQPYTEHQVVAYGQGGTFSAAGLRMMAPELRPYLAYYFEADGVTDPNEAVRVRAIDITAALLWLREHYHGPFSLYVETASTYLGEFNDSEEGQSCDSRCREFAMTPCPIHRDREGQS